jgi:hypothetical protein
VTSPSPVPAARGTGRSGLSLALQLAGVFLAGAGYGLLMRVGFEGIFRGDGAGNSAMSVMMVSFVVLVPLLIGALTVYFGGEHRGKLWFALLAPAIPVLAFIAGTAVLLIEGSICIAMASPLFVALGAVGGFSMWVLLRLYQPRRSTMLGVLALPLLFGAVETRAPLPDRVQASTGSIQVDAPPERVWQLINHAVDIRPDEMRDGLAYRIGVPFPLSAHTVAPGVGGTRELRWDKGVSFDEPITAWEENRYIRWDYRFGPDSFPAGALDEHVVIGGRYFDLRDTSYRLTPNAGGTRLDIHVTYRVSTNFNWYAGPLGRLLIDDAAHTILAFYKHRAEAAVVAGGAR